MKTEKKHKENEAQRGGESGLQRNIKEGCVEVKKIKSSQGNLLRTHCEKNLRVSQFSFLSIIFHN